jgi:hypothetical protein
LQQMPLHLAYSEFPEPDERLLRALEKCRDDDGDLWAKICNATSIWMMANSEDPALSDDAVLTLSAIAFEYLLGGDGAEGVARNFADVWGKYSLIFAGQSEKLKSFGGAEAGQDSWRLLGVWMYHFHKHRSAFVHNGASNISWEPMQLAVLQAFAFGWTVKLLLERADLFKLNDSDEDTLFAFEELLEHWDIEMERWDAVDDPDPEAKYDRKNWSTILSTVSAIRSPRRALEPVFEKYGN